jgi:hypothetical protein
MVTRRAASIACLVAAAAWLALVVPAAGASSTSASKWASGVCSAVQTFGDSVQSTLSGLKNASSLDDASQSVKKGLDDATQVFKQSIDDLGSPSGGEGKKAKSDVQDLQKQLSSDVSAIEDLLSPPPSSAQEIAATFSQIGSQVQKAASQVKSTANDLKGLKPDGTLKKAFQSSSQCKQLKKSLQGD